MKSFRRLRAFLRPYRRHMAAVIAATLEVTGLNLSLRFYHDKQTGEMMSRIGPHPRRSYLGRGLA